MSRGLPWRGPLFLGLALGLLSTPPAAARSGGILRSEGLSASGCNACHSGGGAAPIVEIVAGDEGSVARGATVPVQIRISAAYIQAGGFNLRVASGTLTDRPEQATRIETSSRREVTHSQPWYAEDVAGTVIFKVDWTAPQVLGPVVFEAHGLASEGGTSQSRAQFVSQIIEVRCPRDYVDEDGDGFGVDGTATERCSGAPPSRTALRGGDCDDADPSVSPASSEVCNGRDENCNGETDEFDFDAPALCSQQGEICWAGTCQPPPSLDAGTDAGAEPDGGLSEDGGSRDGGTTEPADAGPGPDQAFAEARGCSGTSGAASLSLTLLAWWLLRARRARQANSCSRA
jgi:hypothetical protein